MTATPRRLSNDELLRRAERRAALTSDYAPEGGVTADDVADASPAVVAAWMRAGKLTGLGVAPPHGRKP